MYVSQMCLSYRESKKGPGVKKGSYTNSRCPFYRGVSLMESKIKGLKKSRDQL